LSNKYHYCLNKVKFITAFFAIIFFQFAFADVSFAQTSLNKDKLLVLKIGKGVNFGGYGLNTEFRKNKFSVQLFGGYNPERVLDSVIVKDSYNFGLNSFYYFFDSKSPIKPKIGIHLGWLNNYYNEKIGHNKYNQNVYGLALIPGLEFGDGIVRFGLNLIIDPGFAIIDKKNHPYYTDAFYFSSSFGMGIDIVGLNKFIKTHKVLKFFDKNAKKGKSNNDSEKEVNTIEKTTIEDKCFTLEGISESISKGICGENAIYQQISSDKFVIVEFERNISDYIGTNTFSVKDDLYAHVYIISKASYNDFCSVIGTTKEYVKATEGKITLLIEENPQIQETSKVSVMLKDLMISTQINNETKVQFFDEIVICNLIH